MNGRELEAGFHDAGAPAFTLQSLLMRIAAAVLLFTALCWAGPRLETGEINGAKFRIDIPENWNGGLVMYCHGYNPKPVVL